MTTPAHTATSTPFWNRLRPSQAALVASAVGVALLAVFLLNWAAYRSQPQRVAWSDYMQWPQLLGLGCLWAVICGLTYWLVRLWHEELPSDDRSIESAWQAGLKVLAGRGLSLDEVPVFVVLGNVDRAHSQRLLELGGMALQHELVPNQADAPLHWAFTDQGVWLFVHGAGIYSGLSRRLAMRPVDHTAMEAASVFVARASTPDYQPAPWATSKPETHQQPANSRKPHAVWQASMSDSNTDTHASTRGDTSSLTAHMKSAGTVASTSSPATSVGSATIEATSADSLGVGVWGLSDLKLSGIESTTMAIRKADATSVSATTALDSLEELLRDASQAESVADGPITGPKQPCSSHRRRDGRRN